MQSILAVSRLPEVHETLKNCFRNEYRVDEATSKEACFQAFREKRYEFLFIDIEFLGNPRNGDDYRTSLRSFWSVYPTLEIIVISSPERIRDAVLAVKTGASDYLTHPIKAEEAQYVVESLLETVRMESELDYLRDQFWQSDSQEVLQTRSPAMKKVFEKIRAVAPTRTTVLLMGETGTGKTLLAKLIHRHSHRSDRQFISVHCGAIPETLLESELFGHEKGAFTGAIRRKLGKFEIANEGSIFLDEIGTVSPSAQIKMLSVLQDKSFHRVGGEAAIEVDVRILAATNSDLKEMNNRGLFRSDLYYRLSVFPIDVPPLRDRTEDLPLLTQAFLKRLNVLYGKEVRDVHPHVMEAFVRYAWPGNIRELENLVERAHILETSTRLMPESVPPDLFAGGDTMGPIVLPLSLSLSEVRRRGVEKIEAQYLQDQLAAHGGRIGHTAEAAGITPRQLHKLMKKHGIRKEEFKNKRRGNGAS